MSIIRARPSLAGACALLQRAGLPTQDLTEAHLQHFLFAGDADAPTGLVGLELSPPSALLRSLAVDAALRRHGLGTALLTHAEAHARAAGARSLYLLTTSAESFFATRGFVRIERSAAPAFIRASTEFSSLCPASAAFMVKHLEE